MSCAVAANVSNCSTAQEIATYSYFRTAVIFESIFGAYAFLSNAFLLVVGWRVTIFPPNLLLLLGHVSLVLAWYGLGGLIKGVYLLITSPCDVSISTRRCRIFEIATTNAALPCMLFGLSALCVERVYATIRFRRYDESPGGRPYLAVISIAVIWSATLGMNFYGFECISEKSFMALCDSLVFASGDTLIPYLSFYLALETLAVAATVFVHAYNRHALRNMAINRALYDLSARFRVDQNAQVNAVMLPSVLLHLVCFLPNYALMLLFVDIQPREKATFVHASYLWREVYAGAHPTLAFVLNPHLRHKLYQFLSRLGVNVAAGPKTTDVTTRSRVEREAHFRHLENLWSAQRPPLIRPRVRTLNNSLSETAL